MKTEETAGIIIAGIKNYFARHNFSKAVIGLSGGIDSSVTAFLAAKALGSRNVIGIMMPEEGLTSEQSTNDAMEVVRALNINSHKIPINNFIAQFHSINQNHLINKTFNNENIMDYKDKNDINKINGDNINPNEYNNILAIANAKARMRMSILYFFANMHNALVVGTSNKSEIVLGYATKYGDGASDIIPIGDLWKTQVMELAEHLGIPQKILNKAPTAELVSGVTDESELGADYEILDRILRLHFEQGASHDEIISSGFDRELVRNVFGRIKTNEHKRRMPVIIGLSYDYS